MRKDRIAEWLLVLVTSRERAASIVGDMMESAATHSVWFWSSVLRTTASLLWRGFAASPRGMLVLAFRGWLMGLLLAFGVFVCIAVGIGLYPRLPLAESTAVLSRAVYAADLVGLTLCQFLVGRWIARLAPGRELSAWLALMIMEEILNLMLSIVPLTFGHRFPIEDWSWRSLTWTFAWMDLPCLAGTIWVRRRAVA